MLANGKSRLPIIISETEIEELEQWMDAFDEKLEPLQYFILPVEENRQLFTRSKNHLQKSRTFIGISE